MAAALFAHRLAQRRVPAQVDSAGLLEEGRRANEASARAAQRYGIDLNGHRSQLLRREQVQDADLVVGMARRHVREAVLLCPESWPRAFTLRELARRGERIGPRTREPLETWLARAQLGRTHEDLVGVDDADDLADPYGLPLEEHEATAVELDQLVTRLVDLAWPRSGTRDAT